MSSDNIILKVENVSKQYRLGTVGTGTISHDLNRWWYKIRGKEDPYLKIGETNDRSTKGSSEYVWALKDINFEVRKGEVLGIIGKNGAGKSTLLKILSKVTTPTTGSIKSRGRIASLLEVGTGFNPELTGRENIYLNGAILGMTKAEITSKLDEIIAFSGCERYIDTPTKRYSSGMTVRLAFAVAAFLEPEILVIDEVLAVGDAEFQKKAIGKMQDIAKGEGRTVLFVSHDMAAISALSNNVIVMVNGTCSTKMKTQDGISEYLKMQHFSDKIALERELNKELYLKNIYLNNDSKLKIQIEAGDQLELEFQLNKMLTFSELKSVAFYVVLKNELNFPLLTLSTRYDSKISISEFDSDTIKCVINSFPLAKGNYICNTWMSYKGGFCDEVVDAFEINVISSDYYKTSQMPEPRKHGAFLIKQDWSTKRNER